VEALGVEVLDLNLDLDLGDGVGGGPERPGATARQRTLQPVLVVSPSVLNSSQRKLLLLLMVAGKEDPQLFLNKIDPSPSVIVRWS